MTQGVNRGMRMPTTADLMSMWNASGLKEKVNIYFSNACPISIRYPYAAIRN